MRPLITLDYIYNTMMHTRSLFSAILPSARDLIPNGKIAKENTKILKSVVTVNAWRNARYRSINKIYAVVKAKNNSLILTAIHFDIL